MIEDFRKRLERALKDEQADILNSLVQLNMPTMQGLGEQHAVLAAKSAGITIALNAIEDIYADMTGAKPSEEKEQGVYE